MNPFDRLRHELETLTKERDQLRADCAKWEEGCRVNADNARDALLAQDRQRLEILKLRADCAVKDSALKKLRDACICADVIEELPSEIDGSLLDLAGQALSTNPGKPLLDEIKRLRQAITFVIPRVQEMQRKGLNMSGMEDILERALNPATETKESK